MPILLYCVTSPNESVSIAAGVCKSDVLSQELGSLRVYWSEISNPEACLGDAESMRKAKSQFQQVLQQILAAITPVPFPFPTLVASAAELEQYFAAELEKYYVTLERIGDAVQYEIIASWPADEQLDLATPVKGGEYVKRRQEAAQRIAAVDGKLRSVTGDSVREWRARQERKTHRWYALVPRKDRERFVASLRSAGPSEGVRLRLSGPWPPTEFIATGDT
jgi:Gas vesicle synthesis protein GvpL/GvpF